MNRAELVTRNALHKIQKEAAAYGESGLVATADRELHGNTTRLGILVRSIVESVLENVVGEDGK